MSDSTTPAAPTTTAAPAAPESGPGPAAAAWRVLGASAGRQSRQAAGGNEDAWLAASRPDGTLLLAVADGAGSARRAAAGSRLAVRAAVRALSSQPLPGSGGWDARLRSVLRQTRAALFATARRRGHAVGDLACTLLLGVCTAEEVAALQLGDGAVVGTVDGALRRLTPPARGEHAGETVFVTSKNAVAAAATAVVPTDRVESLAILTDGLEPVATDLRSGAPWEPFFAPLLAFAAADRPAPARAAELEAFLRSDRVQSRSGDDTTLVLAVRR